MTLGLYLDHFVLIKELNKLCKCFKCDKCHAIFARSDNLLNHQKTKCEELYVDKFVEGITKFEHNPNIMKEILEFNNSNKSFIYPYFCAFDFESIAKDIDQRKGDNTIILNKQVPISLSIYSNLGYDVKHLVNKDPKQLIKDFVDELNNLSDVAYKSVMEQYFDLIVNYCKNN